MATKLAPTLSGFVTFDGVGGRLFLMSGSVGSQLLHIVGVRSGTITSQPIPNPDAYNNFFEYDVGATVAVPVLGLEGIAALTALLALSGALLLRQRPS